MSHWGCGGLWKRRRGRWRPVIFSWIADALQQSYSQTNSMSVIEMLPSHGRGPRAGVRIRQRRHKSVKIEDPYVRIFLRIVVIGVLSIGMTLSVWWKTFNNSLTPTIGSAVTMSTQPHSLGGGIRLLMVVDFLVSFGFLFGVWFLWTQGRNLKRGKGRSAPGASRLRIAGILVVASLCALPLAYYVLLVKSRFHTGLADTPDEVMESRILSVAICAIALGGIAILGRVWHRANPDSPRTQS
jgi:hypothetical protein